MPQTSYEIAVACIARGWPVVPVFEHIKRAFTKDYATSIDKLNEHWRQFPMARCGVVVGPVSGLIDIDCDDQAAIATADQWLAERNIKPVHSFDSPRGRHYLIRWSQELAAQAIGKMQIRVGHSQHMQHVIIRSI